MKNRPVAFLEALILLCCVGICNSALGSDPVHPQVVSPLPTSYTVLFVNNENRSFEKVVGNTNTAGNAAGYTNDYADYYNGTLVGMGTLLTNHYADQHGSLDGLIHFFTTTSGFAVNGGYATYSQCTAVDPGCMCNDGSGSKPCDEHNFAPCDSSYSVGPHSTGIPDSEMPNLVQYLNGAGRTWKSYNESLGSSTTFQLTHGDGCPSGYCQESFDGHTNVQFFYDYLRRHNPAIYFQNASGGGACSFDSTHFVAAGPSSPILVSPAESNVYQSDLDANHNSGTALPSFMWLNTADTHDAHSLVPGGQNCGTGTGCYVMGSWDVNLNRQVQSSTSGSPYGVLGLGGWQGPKAGSSAFVGRAVAILTFDEGDGEGGTKNNTPYFTNNSSCNSDTTKDTRLKGNNECGGGGRIATLLIGPNVRVDYSDMTQYDHEDVLQTICALENLNPDTQCPTKTNLTGNTYYGRVIRSAFNLMWDSSFEYNGGAMTNDFLDSGSISGGTATINTDVNVAHFGQRYLRLSTPGDGGGAAAGVVLDQKDDNGNQVFYPVYPGDVITFGVWAKNFSGSGTDGSGRIEIDYYKNDKVTKGGSVVPSVNGSGTSSTWTQETGTWVVPASIGGQTCGDGMGQQCYITMKLVVWNSDHSRTEDFDDAYMYIDPGPITVGSMSNQANGNLAFSNKPINMTQELSFTLTNNDSTAHAISSKVFSRGYPSQKFSPGSTDTCGTSIAAGATCTLSVKFAPGSSTGSFNSIYTVSFSDSGTVPPNTPIVIRMNGSAH